MDQFASGLGRRGHALRIDCRTQAVAAVPMPDLALLVAHSGVERRLAEGGYRARVAECRAAFAAGRAAGVGGPAARSLRDFALADLPALEAELESRLFRRARHVIAENARVDALVAALGTGDRAQIGAILRAGQASLRDDFEVSTPELDALCEVGDSLDGVVGSRLTGAGFGGCTLHLVAPGAAAEAARALAAGFAERFGRTPRVLLTRAADGASSFAI
jgi:galactokinase